MAAALHSWHGGTISDHDAPCTVQVGGEEAPSPLGDMGIRLMADALDLNDVEWTTSGSDLVVTGYLPASKGPAALHQMLLQRDAAAQGTGVPAIQ